jgi:glycosyltransferase involved in cell wall biosynthesis
MEVAVVIPCKNEELHIGSCLRSLTEQSFLMSYEIIIVDDCSTDNTLRLIDAYSQYESKSLKITVLENEQPKGIGGSVNRGVLASSARYVVRVDADDYVSKYFLQTLYLSLHESTFKSTTVDYSVVDVDGQLLVRHISWKECPIACGLMLETDLLIRLGLYESSPQNEEVKLNDELIRLGLISHVPIPLYRYRRHDGNTAFSSKGVRLSFD